MSENEIPLWSVASVVRKVVEPASLGDKVFHYSIPSVDELGDGKVELSSEIKSSKLQIKGDEVLVSKLNPRKSRVIMARRNELPVVASTEFVALRPLAIERRFLFYLLCAETTRRTLDSRVQSVTRSHQRVDPADIARLRLRPPPVEEQRRIADFLDAETLRIDALAETHRKLIAVIRERFATLVDSELRSASHAEVPLRRLLCRPPEYGSQAAGEEGETTWPRYIRITDLSQDGGLKTNDVKRLAPNLAKPFMLEDGDIVLARSGATVGKGFLYRAAMGAACFAGYLVRIRPVKDLLPEYLSLWLRTRHYWDQIKTVSTQATIQNVSADRYGSLLFPIAGRNLQGGIAERLSKEHKRITALEEAVKQQLDLLAERRQALITAAVTGQLDVTTARSGVR